MKFFLSSLLLSLGLLGCQKDSDLITEPASSPNGLTGTWQLTNRQCFCARTPLPNETVKFTANRFSFYEDGQLTGQGTYQNTVGQLPCSDGLEGTVISFIYAAAPSAATPFAGNATFTLTDNELTLDYGSPCDAPRDTYRRLP